MRGGGRICHTHTHTRTYTYSLKYTHTASLFILSLILYNYAAAATQITTMPPLFGWPPCVASGGSQAAKEGAEEGTEERSVWLRLLINCLPASHSRNISWRATNCSHFNVFHVPSTHSPLSPCSPRYSCLACLTSCPRVFPLKKSAPQSFRGHLIDMFVTHVVRSAVASWATHAGLQTVETGR